MIILIPLCTLSKPANCQFRNRFVGRDAETDKKIDLIYCSSVMEGVKEVECIYRERKPLLPTAKEEDK